MFAKRWQHQISFSGCPEQGFPNVCVDADKYKRSRNLFFIFLFIPKKSALRRIWVNNCEMMNLISLLPEESEMRPPSFVDYHE